MEFEKFLSFLIASILLTLAPGPDNLYLLAKSLKDGSRAGICLSAGLSSGIFFHTFLVLIGVAAFIKNSTIAMMILKCFGMIYLLYLASLSFRSLRKKSELNLKMSTTSENFSATYFRGVLMNVSNPKVLLFFLAFLPSFVNLEDPNSSWHIFFLGVTFAVQAFVIFSLISIGAGKLRSFISRSRNFGKILSAIEGTVLTVIALSLIFI